MDRKKMDWRIFSRCSLTEAEAIIGDEATREEILYEMLHYKMCILTSLSKAVREIGHPVPAEVIAQVMTDLCHGGRRYVLRRSDAALMPKDFRFVSEVGPYIFRADEVANLPDHVIYDQIGHWWTRSGWNNNVLNGDASGGSEQMLAAIEIDAALDY
jgi:hypothetical protein